jgi:protease-4
MRPWALAWGRWGYRFATPLRAVRARRLVRPGSFVSLVIDGPVVELSEPTPWWRRRRTSVTTLSGVRQLCSAVARDDRVKGLLVEIRSLRAGAATATSLRRALAGLREKQKTVIVYLPTGAGSREMLVASAAHRIIMGPQATIAPMGVAVQTRYLRRALDKIGVLPEIFARGEFKTAGESLARDSMSNEQREQIGAILDVLERELLDGLSEGRRLSASEARALVDGGPYRAAEEKRLVDAVGYDDDLPNLIEPNALPIDGKSAKNRRAPMVNAGPYLAVRRPPPPSRRIGVVHVRGPIVSRVPVALGRVAVDERVVGALRRAREARGVSGVIVLIDSPGGSVLASDRIHHEVVRLAEKKPVVAYFSNVAASGGYYVAAGAHSIVAEPTTLTGSIGVVAGHLVLAPLLEKLGIVTELVKRGARADMLSAARALDAGEREAMTREIEGYYVDFVNVVARGRRRPAEEIEKLARGRVYSGLDAHKVGLVDHLGGFDVAIDVLKDKMGESRPVGPEVVRPPRTMPKPPEVPAPFVQAIDAIGGRAARELVALALGLGPREIALAWGGFLGSDE